MRHKRVLAAANQMLAVWPDSKKAAAIAAEIDSEIRKDAVTYARMQAQVWKRTNVRLCWAIRKPGLDYGIKHPEITFKKRHNAKKGSKA